MGNDLSLGFRCALPGDSQARTLTACAEQGGVPTTPVKTKNIISKGDERSGLYFSGPVAAMTAVTTDSALKETLALMRGIETLTDSKGVKIKLRDNTGSEVILSAGTGEVMLEQLQAYGLIKADGSLTEKGQKLLKISQSASTPAGKTIDLEAAEAQVTAAASAPLPVAATRGEKALIATLRALGKDNWIPFDGNLPHDELVHNGHPAEIDFYGFETHWYKPNDSLKDGEKKGLVGVLNGLRSNASFAGKVRILVGKGGSTEFPGYTMKEAKFNGGRVRYCVIEENGQPVLVIGVSQNQLSSAALATGLAGVKFERPAPPPPPALTAEDAQALEDILTEMPELVGEVKVAILPADQFSGADQAPVNVRLVQRNTQRIYLVQIREGAPIDFNQLHDVLENGLASTQETVQSATYDADKKLIHLSLYEGTSSHPVKKAHIARIVRVVKGKEITLQANVDYIINNDGTISLLKQPAGKSTYRVYLQIGSYPLDYPAEVTVETAGTVPSPARGKARRINTDDY